MELAHTALHTNTSSFGREALPWLPHVARYARVLTKNHPDADDLTQETFLRAYKGWSTFQPGSNCRKWLFAICRNRFLRDRERAWRVDALEDWEDLAHATTPVFREVADRRLADLLDHVDIGPAFERSVQAMQPEYRSAVVLVDVEQYSYADAATALGVPIGTVRSRLHRGRRLLQTALIEHARDLGFTGEVFQSVSRRASQRSARGRLRRAAP